MSNPTIIAGDEEEETAKINIKIKEKSVRKKEFVDVGTFKNGLINSHV